MPVASSRRHLVTGSGVSVGDSWGGRLTRHSSIAPGGSAGIQPLSEWDTVRSHIRHFFSRGEVCLDRIASGWVNRFLLSTER